MASDDWEVYERLQMPDDEPIDSGSLAVLLDKYSLDDHAFVSPSGGVIRFDDAVEALSSYANARSTDWEEKEKRRQETLKNQQNDIECDDCGSTIPEGKCRCPVCHRNMCDPRSIECVKPGIDEVGITEGTVDRAFRRGLLRGITKQNHDILQAVRQEYGYDLYDKVISASTAATRKNIKRIRD